MQEISKAVTSGIDGSFWFMLEPLLMSKSIYDGLSPAAQKAISEIGAGLEGFALEGAKSDDKLLSEVYGKAGATTKSFDAAVLDQWKAIAKRTAWQDFAARNQSCADLLALAEKVPAAA